MATIGGGSAAFRLAVRLEPTLAHDARHPLVVDRPALTSQLVRDAPIAILWPRGCHLFDGVLQASICEDSGR